MIIITLLIEFFTVEEAYEALKLDTNRDIDMGTRLP